MALVFFLLLNAAAVLPAIHQLWHDQTGCAEPDCVVMTLAHGNLDADVAPVSLPAPSEVAFALPTPPAPVGVARDDCPLLPARAPPA